MGGGHETIEEIVWRGYKEQSEDFVKHGVAIVLPDESRVYCYGTLLAVRARSLYELLDNNTIDLTGTELSSLGLRGVLDHIHGGVNVYKDDLEYICHVLKAAYFIGADFSKGYIEERVIKTHDTTDPKSLRVLRETAETTQCEKLYDVITKALEDGDDDVLPGHNVEVIEKSKNLFDILDRHLPKRVRQTQEVAVGDSNGTIRIYDGATGCQMRTLVGCQSSLITSLAYASDTLLAAASYDKSVSLWNTETSLCVFTVMHSNAVCNVAFFTSLQNILYLASASSDRTSKIWDTESGACLQTLQQGSGVGALAASTHLQLLAFGCFDRRIRIWTSTTFSQIQTLQGHSKAVSTLAFSPTTNLLASGASDRYIRLWSTDTWNCLHVLSGHIDHVRSIAWSPTADLLVSGSQDTTMRFWNPTNGHCIRILTQLHTACIFSIEFSPDSTQIFTCSSDNTICISDPSTGRLIRRIHHDLQCNSLALRPPPS